MVLSQYYHYMKTSDYTIIKIKIDVWFFEDSFDQRASIQEIIETCLQVLNFEVVGPDVRKKNSPLFYLSK